MRRALPPVLLRPVLLRPVLLGAVLAATLTGCGGGSSTSSAPLSKADYVSRADAICASATTALKKLTPPTGTAGLGPYLSSTVQAAGGATDALRALRPPKADAAALAAKFTGPLSAQVASVKQLIPKYEAATKAANPQAALAAIPRPQLPSPDAGYISSYGMTACAALTQGGS